MSDPIIVEVETPPAIEVEIAQSVIEVTVTGGPGPAGPPPSDEEIQTALEDYLAENPLTSGVEHLQVAPSASWVIPHSIGRRPAVTVFIGNEEVLADVAATTTQVTVTFASPQSGSALLT